MVQKYIAKVRNTLEKRKCIGQNRNCTGEAQSTVLLKHEMHQTSRTQVGEECIHGDLSHMDPAVLCSLQLAQNIGKEGGGSGQTPWHSICYSSHDLVSYVTV